MFDFLEHLIKWSTQIIRLLWPPLTAEVSYFRYEEQRSSPGDRLVVISAWPCRYHAELSVTNRADRAVFIKSVTTTIDGECTFPPAETEVIRLDSHEVKQLSVIFPTDKAQNPREAGKFRIDIFPSVGRKTAIRGLFPIG